jgi:hypothetical protein
MGSLENNLQPEAQRYNKKINSLSEQFFSVLDDFTKYYVFFNKNPEVNEYQQIYLNNKSQLQNLNKNVFLLTNDIEKDIEKLNYIVTRLNAKLGDEKDLNGELLYLFGNLKNTTNSSSVMLDDSVSIYNKQYYLNTDIFLGSIMCLGLIVHLLQNKK